MKSRQSLLLKIFGWTAIVLFFIRCLFSSPSLFTNFELPTLVGFASESISATIFLTVLYEKLLWRWLSFGTVPRLQNEYSATIKSTYQDKPIKATIQIKQTFLSIRVFLQTNESSSASINADFETILGETYLIYCYRNIPKTAVRDRSNIHFGTTLLKIDESDVLSGTYYTDRNYQGDIVLRVVKNKKTKKK